MESSDNSLIVSNATFGYKIKKFRTETKVILKNVNIEVKAGEIAVILGDNGSGKTTLLRGICGLLNPLRGKIVISNKKNKNSKIAYLPQLENTFPWLKVINDSSLLLQLSDISRKKAFEITQNTLEKMNLDIDGKKRMFQLSGGQRQKVAIARCLVVASFADLIVLDEPTNHLDKDSRKSFVKQVPLLFKNISCPTIIATHDHDLGNMLSDNTFRIVDGKVI